MGDRPTGARDRGGAPGSLRFAGTRPMIAQDCGSPMRTQVQIDRMGQGDLAAVVALDAPAPIREEELRAELLRPWSRLWVAREADAFVVAFLVAWHVADEIHVLNLVTRPDRRRRGIARALLNEVVDYARRSRAVRMLLEVRRSNRAAITLYRSLGFYAFGIRARYYPDNEDAIEMVAAFDLATGFIEPRPDEVHLSR